MVMLVHSLHLALISVSLIHAPPRKSRQSEFLERAKQRQSQYENHVSIAPPDKLGQAAAATWSNLQTVLQGSDPVQAVGALRSLLPGRESR
jgi:phage terminase small subunit